MTSLRPADRSRIVSPSTTGPGGRKLTQAAPGVRGAKAVAEPPLSLSGGQRLKLTTNLSRQLQVLVSTGTPLSQALYAVERTARANSWKSVISKLRKDVEEGTALSVSMRQAGVFDPVALSLVSAGESSGNMPLMLSRLADLSRRELKMRTAVLAAMVYPSMLIVLGIGVLLTMLLFVLPRFATLFASLDSPLPATTRWLMLASELLRTQWLALLGALLALILGVGWVVRSGRARAILDRHVLELPMIGDLFKSVMSARISRMLGTLLESKVPLLESLELTRAGCVNREYADLISRAESAVQRGEPLSSVIENSPLIVASVQEAIRNGEHSGQVGLPLCQLADFLDEENDVVLKTVTSIIEPAILIVMGIAVGFIAISIFLPMFDLITAAQGGGH